MTTTDFIKLLTEYEFGGATGRPREVMFEVDDEIYETDGVEVTGSGDGLFTELFLSLPSAKRKTGKWIDHSDDGYVECPFCGSATNCDDNINELHYCFSCGAKMEVEG